MNLLITGGAGYIGSHVARQLSEQGDSVTVFDNLSTGSREALLYSEKLIHADLADEKALTEAVSNGRFDAVLHFAASIEAAKCSTASKRPLETASVSAFSSARSAWISFSEYNSASRLPVDRLSNTVTESPCSLNCLATWLPM